MLTAKRQPTQKVGSLVVADDDTMKATVLGLFHALFLDAVVAEIEEERYVSSCEPHILPRGRGTLEYRAPNRRSMGYNGTVECEWMLQPLMLPSGVPSKCNRMIATLESLHTGRFHPDKDEVFFDIVDTSTDRVLASLSRRSIVPGFPKQYVACSHRLTIRFKSIDYMGNGTVFRISYTTDSA